MFRSQQLDFPVSPIRKSRARQRFERDALEAKQVAENHDGGRPVVDEDDDRMSAGVGCVTEKRAVDHGNEGGNPQDRADPHVAPVVADRKDTRDRYEAEEQIAHDKRETVRHQK